MDANTKTKRLKMKTCKGENFSGFRCKHARNNLKNINHDKAKINQRNQSRN